MNKVTRILINEVEQSLRDLAKDARDGKLTYYYMLAQYEDEEYVEWKTCESGNKSFDPQHLLTEIGQYYIVTQSVFQEICEIAAEEEL
tara:strand:+ start:3047 stop:3310 length:264 start_codon:yes stop_codon:yes gene_type:complete